MNPICSKAVEADLVCQARTRPAPTTRPPDVSSRPMDGRRSGSSGADRIARRAHASRLYLAALRSVLLSQNEGVAVPDWNAQSAPAAKMVGRTIWSKARLPAGPPSSDARAE